MVFGANRVKGTQEMPVVGVLLSLLALLGRLEMSLDRLVTQEWCLTGTEKEVINY